MAYRLFGCAGDGTSTDVIVDAIARALVDGADVINLSLGGPGGFAASAGNVVASRVARLGVPVIVAAGNGGNSGAFNAGEPDAAEFGIAVASVQSTALIGFEAKVVGVPALKRTFILKPRTFIIPANQSQTLQVRLIENACTPDKVPALSRAELALYFRSRAAESVSQKSRSRTSLRKAVDMSLHLSLRLSTAPLTARTSMASSNRATLRTRMPSRSAQPWQLATSSA